jgi:chaperonin GroEL
MVYRPKVDDRLCFALMPFGNPFDSYYIKIIRPAAEEAGLATLRSDEIRGRQAIIKDIWERIWAARVVIADVTGRNANVNYELGICDALGVPTIIIAAKIEDAPFDYKHRRIIIYNRDDPGWDDKLRTDLAETIRTVLTETKSEDEFEWPYDTTVLREPALSGVLIASAESRKIVIRGAKLVSDAIASAYGPRGASVAISQAFGATRQAQRGALIAQGVKSSNPLEEKGIEQIRLAASAVYESEGDCSKLVSIFTAGLMTRGQELIERDFHPKDVLAGLERSVERALALLQSYTQVVSAKELLAVATTASGGDVRIGGLVVEAMKKAGKNGIVAVETADEPDVRLAVTEGVQFDRGYLSEYFATNAETLDCVLEDCLILLYQGRIQSMRDLLPLLEHVARGNESLLVIADDVEGEALATLTLNKIRGTLRCAAVKSPGEGDRRRALMEDIAVLTGGKFLSTDLGVPLMNVSTKDLGKAEKIVLTLNNTTITGGAGSNEAIQDRVRSIQTQISNTLGAYDRERLQERLARLGGSVAVLKVGGVSEAEVLEIKYQVESALNAARSAIENGWVVGGGVALLRVALALNLEIAENGVDVETMRAVASILEEPTRQLIENAKKSPTQIVTEILAHNSADIGYNVERCEIQDLRSNGILDASAPISRALLVALSHARSVLQTGTWDISPPPTPSLPR